MRIRIEFSKMLTSSLHHQENNCKPTANLQKVAPYLVADGIWTGSRRTAAVQSGEEGGRKEDGQHPVK
jgi:hypothetical protein